METLCKFSKEYVFHEISRTIFFWMGGLLKLNFFNGKVLKRKIYRAANLQDRNSLQAKFSKETLRTIFF